MQAATRADWRIKDMPTEYVALTLDFTLSAQEAARVRLGFIPTSMEEKWFAYFADNTLHQHRSWTGYCIDQIFLKPMAMACELPTQRSIATQSSTPKPTMSRISSALKPWCAN